MNLFHNIYKYNFYQFARTFLLFGLILTLLFNKFDILFIKNLNGLYINPYVNNSDLIARINFFRLLNYNQVICRSVVIIIFIFVASGLFPQISGVLHLWVSLSYFFSSVCIDGGDQVHMNLTILLLPICLLDTRKNAWIKSNNKVSEFRFFISNIFLVLISIQMSVIYFQAAIAKFNVIEWSNGTALYYWFNHSLFGIPRYLHFLNHLYLSPFITTILTYGVMIVELLLSGAIFMNIKFKKYIFIIGIIFHLMIIFLLGIASFFFSMLGGLILYLLPYSKFTIYDWKK